VDPSVAYAKQTPCDHREQQNRRLEVSGTPTASGTGSVLERWQLLTLKGDRIADIRGFDDRAATAVRAGLPA
jgi:hypothetical protein